jgi:hypothetical protein
MTINRNNFEAYLLDYVEGNLDPLLTADLMAFLAENPEFEKYLPDYDNALTISGTLTFNRKNQLKKELSDLPEITRGNFDEFCIADCEGLLGERDLTRLRDYISRYPERQRDLDLYRKIKLQPDTSVRYSGRNRLKKNRRPVNLRYVYFAMGIAASLALLILLVFRKPAGSVYTETLPVNSDPIENAVRPPDALPAVSDILQNTMPVPVIESRTKASTVLIPATLPVETQMPYNTNHALTALVPISGEPMLSSIQPLPVSVHLKPIIGHKQNQKQILAYASDSFADTRLGSLLSRLDLWKTADIAITGFNYLTESKLTVGRTTDDNGKLTSLLIQGESYEITGKIK